MDIVNAVRELCIRKLARILYDCVECSESDRALIDWRAAEQVVDANRHFVARMVQVLVDDALWGASQRRTYKSGVTVQGVAWLEFKFDPERFEQVCGKAVWDDLYQPMVLSSPYTRVRFG